MDQEFEKVIEKLKKKQFAKHKLVWIDEKSNIKRKLGKYVFLRQSNFPLKLIMLQEVYMENECKPEIRIGYYMLSPKKLREESKLQIVWDNIILLYQRSILKSWLIEQKKQIYFEERVNKYLNSPFNSFFRLLFIFL